MGQPSLLDLLEPMQEAQTPPVLWQEVPQALFNSWSVAQQFAYCAERDRNAAADPYCDPEWRSFYSARAQVYTTSVAAHTECAHAVEEKTQTMWPGEHFLRSTWTCATCHHIRGRA